MCLLRLFDINVFRFWILDVFGRIFSSKFHNLGTILGIWVLREIEINDSCFFRSQNPKIPKSKGEIKFVCHPNRNLSVYSISLHKMSSVDYFTIILQWEWFWKKKSHNGPIMLSKCDRTSLHLLLSFLHSHIFARCLLLILIFSLCLIFVKEGRKKSS